MLTTCDSPLAKKSSTEFINACDGSLYSDDTATLASKPSDEATTTKANDELQNLLDSLNKPPFVRQMGVQYDGDDIVQQKAVRPETFPVTCTCGTKIKCPLKPASKNPFHTHGYFATRIHGDLAECAVYEHHKYGPRVTFKGPATATHEELIRMFDDTLEGARLDKLRKDVGLH